MLLAGFVANRLVAESMPDEPTHHFQWISSDIQSARSLTSTGAVRTFLRLAYGTHLAQVAELVDALVSGTSGAIRGGSSPLLGTIKINTIRAFLDVIYY